MSLDAINVYFRKLYWLKGDDALDATGILRLLREPGASLDFPFETIAAKFRLIETPMAPIIVPWCGTDGRDDTAKRLLEELRWVERPGRIARRLQPYVVQVPPRIRTNLLNAGAAEVVRKADFDHQFVVLRHMWTCTGLKPDLLGTSPNFVRSKGYCTDMIMRIRFRLLDSR